MQPYAKALAMYDLYIMKRTQIYLREEQGRYLQRRSKATGKTVSDLIRSAIDETYLPHPELNRAEKIRIARATAGAWKDFPMTGEEYVERLRGSGRLARLHGLKK
jgi:hypothetical protein